MKAKLSMWNKKCWGMGTVWCSAFPSVAFPLNFIHWKCSIYGKYLGDQCQSSILYILWMEVYWESGQQCNCLYSL